MMGLLLLSVTFGSPWLQTVASSLDKDHTFPALSDIFFVNQNITRTEEVQAEFRLPTSLDNLANGVVNRAAVPQLVIAPVEVQEAGSVEAAAEVIAPRTDEITTYYVESGDTIFGIAAKFDLLPETIMWSNEALGNNPDLLSVGQELIILPVDGVYHQVGASDTVNGIASTFKAEPSDIISHPMNDLNPNNPILQVGQWVIVPGGSRPYIPRTVTAYTGPVPEDATAGTGIFGWPASGSISQGYWIAHQGIDVAAWIGAPVAAADSGHVVAAGWDDTGYGYAVVIDHGNGFQTLYAHMQAYYVDAGDNVAKGQQ